MGAVGGRIRGGSWRGGQREGLSPPPAGPVPRLAAVLFRRCGPPTLCTCGTGKRSSGRGVSCGCGCAGGGGKGSGGDRSDGGRSDGRGRAGPWALASAAALDGAANVM